MSRRTRWTPPARGLALLVAVPALVVAAAVPSPLSGQEGPRAPEPAVQEADALLERALRLERTTSGIVAAARLHERSAGLRESGDPRVAESLWSAANLYYYGGKPARALTVLDRVADEALSRGDVMRAADAYIRASVVATELDRHGEGHRYHRRATLLAGSPLLEPAQRDWILDRLPERSGRSGPDRAAGL